MINPMMYRVFLQDERDAPSPEKNPEDSYRIRYGQILAWCYSSPGWKPTLEEQVQKTSFGQRFGPSHEPLDGVWLINYNNMPVGIAHNIEEIPKKSYELAREQAQNLAEGLSVPGKPYIFIDLTSKGDKLLMQKLSEIVHDEHVYSPSPRAQKLLIM